MTKIKSNTIDIYLMWKIFLQRIKKPQDTLKNFHYIPRYYNHFTSTPMKLQQIRNLKIFFQPRKSIYLHPRRKPKNNLKGVQNCLELLIAILPMSRHPSTQKTSAWVVMSRPGTWTPKTSERLGTCHPCTRAFRVVISSSSSSFLLLWPCTPSPTGFPAAMALHLLVVPIICNNPFHCRNVGVSFIESLSQKLYLQEHF